MHHTKCLHVCLHINWNPYGTFKCILPGKVVKPGINANIKARIFVSEVCSFVSSCIVSNLIVNIDSFSSNFQNTSVIYQVITATVSRSMLSFISCWLSISLKTLPGTSAATDVPSCTMSTTILVLIMFCGDSSLFLPRLPNLPSPHYSNGLGNLGNLGRH